MFRITVHDDREVPHRVPVRASDLPRGFAPLLRRDDRGPDAELERYRQHRAWEVARSPGGSRTFAFLFLLSIWAACTLLLLPGVLESGRIDGRSLVQFGPGALFTGLLCLQILYLRRTDTPAKRSRRGRRARPWDAFRARPSACIACRFDLRGLEPEDDGCTVCPECGAAWRVGEDPDPWSDHRS
ncbi:MAG: hypothetical protein AAGI30_02025 [Planctomycetota bacterium]